VNSRVKNVAALAVVAVGMTLFSSVAQAQSAPAPTDPQIVGIVIAANQIDINHGKLALKKAKDAQVHDFAQQMITDHTAVLKSVNDLGAKLKVTPEESATAKSLRSQAAETTKKLNGLKGKAFDKAYIDSEVAYHQAVIDAVSKVLIPNAKNAELKKALEDTAPAFQGHLEHAEKIQSALGGSTTASVRHSH
jgi:putative membrane protein